MSEPQAVRDDFFDSLLGDFLDESSQLLDRLNENLLQLDEWVRSLGEDHQERCSDELMNEMFRSAHSLKGLSAMLGLKEINNLTHKVENVFDAARKEQLIVSGDVVELMFQAIDRLGGLVETLKDQDASPPEYESVVDGISRLLQAAGAERKQSSQADAERALTTSEPDESPAQAAAPTPSVDEARQEPATLDSLTDEGFADLRDDTELFDKYLSIFIDEADLSLDELTETLLALEGGGSRESLEKLLVTSHRIKGSAASVGLNRAAKLAHLMEDLLQNLVNQGGALSPELTDALLKCTDGLRQYVDALRQGGGKSDRFPDLARELVAAQGPVADSPAVVETAPEVKPPASVAENHVVVSADVPEDLLRQVAALAPESSTALAGEVAFRANLPLVSLKAQLVYEKLANLGQVFFFQPPVERLEDFDEIERIAFGLATEKTADGVARQLRVAGVEKVSVAAVHKASATETPPKSMPSQTQMPAPAASVAKESPRSEPKAEADESAAQGKGRQADASNKPTETLRVDIDRLDSLMNLAGQLVISKARFAQIANRFKHSLNSRPSAQLVNNLSSLLDRVASTGESGGGKTQWQSELEGMRSQARRLQNELESVRREIASLTQARNAMNDLFEAVHQLDRVTDGIQRSVMDTRMVPIGPLFSRFKRVVRDITRTNGKAVRLEINGEKTELDKRMIDELGDPLIHMVRNSADHGIELPEVREAAGKPREGTITLDAFHRGNSILIQVTDDGKGLDPERILSKAIEKGLVNPADADKLTRQQIFALIWEPGLSTAEKVTEVSGRGMGMDIVKSKIEDLNGSIDLDSMPGQGTTITIKLPLTLAILPSLMVEIDRDVFAMPIESVVEIVRVGRKDLTTVHGVATAQVRGRVVGVVRLDDVLAWSGSGRRDETNDEETTLVIVGERGQEIGLSVDHVIGEQDVVIKSMAENYRNVAGIAGASILGDGRVSLILDIPALIDMAAHRTPATATA